MNSETIAFFIGFILGPMLIGTGVWLGVWIVTRR